MKIEIFEATDKGTTVSTRLDLEIAGNRNDNSSKVANIYRGIYRRIVDNGNVVYKALMEEFHGLGKD